MKKNTVLRNESPHAVKMQAGSNVAERKSRKVAGVKEPAAKTKADSPTVSPPVVEAPPAAAKTASRAPAKPRAKARLKSPAQTSAPAARQSSRPPEDPPAVPSPPVLDEAALWEQDSPVKTRLAQLKTRNALLSEQLQRLKSPLPARGKKP